MRQWLRTHGGWWLAWLLVTGVGAVWIARGEIRQLREDFDANGRIAHRLMSQQVVQYDAVLATLALLEPAPGGAPERRLSSVYPSILAVQRHEGGAPWTDPALAAAEARSRELRRPEYVADDFAGGRYKLMMGAASVSYLIDVDLAATVPWRDWPMDPKTSPVRVVLDKDGQEFVVQPGDTTAFGGWRFDFRKTLASESQGFELIAERDVSWRELPWGTMAGWALAVAVVLGGAQALQRQRIERRRAEDLLRLGQVARLNALGELAAGMAHELNQPLTAVLANTQAARRLLDDDPPELATAQDAMKRASEQARRAADVVGRLRRVIERPDRSGSTQPVVVQDVVRGALHLLAPEFARRSVTPAFEDTVHAPVVVLAEPVALEQIVHNLLMNALQALEDVPPGERRLVLAIGHQGNHGVLTVTDSGRGIPPDALPRIFEPFFSTREGGLGLGLSLCETLAVGMGGTLGAEPAAQRGARFILRLPLAGADTGKPSA